MYQTMHLLIALPYTILLDEPEIKRLVIPTPQGSYGIFPNRLDCMASLTSGIVTYYGADDREYFVAVEEGILVKAGREVTLSVRNGITGADLGSLTAAVEADFQEKKKAQSDLDLALAKLERNFIRSFNEITSS